MYSRKIIPELMVPNFLDGHRVTFGSRLVFPNSHRALFLLHVIPAGAFRIRTFINMTAERKQTVSPNPLKFGDESYGRVGLQRTMPVSCQTNISQ